MAPKPFPRGRITESSLLKRLHRAGVFLRSLIVADHVTADLFQHARIDLMPRAGLGANCFSSS
jgi:hypothetical protein